MSELIETPLKSTASSVPHLASDQGTKVMKRKISIIIPAFSAESTLHELLTSLTNSPYPSFEIILVDDLSNDRTLEIAREFPCTIVTLKRRSGAGYARYAGIKYATGEIIAYLDSDCIPHPSFLDEINNNLKEEYAGIDGIYIHNPNPQDNINSFMLDQFNYKNYRKEHLGHVEILVGGACAFWKSALEQRKQYGEFTLCKAVASGDDTLMSYEAREKGPLIHTNTIKVNHITDYSNRFYQKSINMGFTRTLINWYFPHKTPSGITINDLYSPSKKIVSLFASIGFLLASFVTPYALPFLVGTLFYYYLINKNFYSFVCKTSRKKKIFKYYVIDLCRTFCWMIGLAKGMGYIITNKLRPAYFQTKALYCFLFTKKIVKHFFFYTSKCNARCLFCSSYDNVVNASKRKTLSIEEIHKVYKKIPYLPYIVITGGEPFGSPPVITI